MNQYAHPAAAPETSPTPGKKSNVPRGASQCRYAGSSAAPARAPMLVSDHQRTDPADRSKRDAGHTITAVATYDTGAANRTNATMMTSAAATDHGGSPARGCIVRPWRRDPSQAATGDARGARTRAAIVRLRENG